jgi:hypothetical protein
MTLFDVDWSFKGGLLGAGLVLACFAVEWLMRSGVAATVLAQAGAVSRRVRRFRITHCYACKTHLDSQQHSLCFRCGWIVCPTCGACGCGYRWF